MIPPLVRFVALGLVAACLGQPAGLAAADAPVNGFATTVQPLATRAALAAFADGGNAIDAAIAAGLTLGVVDGHNSGIGGGCFILIRLADGRLVCIDGRETAPAAASREMFLRDGRPDPASSLTGPLAVGVPGAVAAYASAVERFGRLPLAAAFEAGIRHAEEGFAIDAVYARKLANTAAELAMFPAAKAIFLQADGSPWPEGHRLVQRDLAATYRRLAAAGPDWFYRGEFAGRTAAVMAATGGLITAADFRDYRAIDREPVVSRYRDWTIVGVPPPSSGGVHVAQMLNVLERFPLAELGPGTPEFTHTVVEAMKLAFADRAHWLGDPAFTPVPKGLVAADYAATLAGRIDPDRARPVPRHGEPPAWQSDHFHKHTTHFATADAEGNWVSITATINTAFGSKVVVPGTGVLLNNEMDDFTAAPGTPNAFGLVGGEANAVAPGKRPLSSMSPTIVLDAAGEPCLSIGAAGGPTIISQVLLGLVAALDFGLEPAEAVAQPRFHHQWRPDRVRLEAAAGSALADRLRALGHEVVVVDTFGAAQLISRTADGSLAGASDPRIPGLAAFGGSGILRPPRGREARGIPGGTPSPPPAMPESLFASLAWLDATFWLTAIGIFLLLLVSAFFSGSETALTAASRGKLRAQADKGSTGAATALAVTEDGERMIGALLLGNNVVNILAASLATALLTKVFGPTGVAVATIVMTLLVLVFGEVLPKTLAITLPEAAASRVAPVILLLMWLFGPIVGLVQRLVRGVLGLFGIQTEPGRNVLSVHEEIAGAIALGHSEGAMEKEDRDRLLGALDLSHRDVSEIMKHRSQIEMIDADKPPTEIVAQVLASPHTRLPVFRGTDENILGVIHAKELLRAMDRLLRAEHGDWAALRELDVLEVAMPPYFIPETTPLDEQMRQFLRRHTHFALVVDEYGALQGLITLEDILEEIVGEITDEFDVGEDQAIEKTEAGDYLVDGTLAIRTLNRALDWQLPDEEANTVAGLVIHEARVIPEVGAAYDIHGFRFEVAGKVGNRLTRLRVSPLPVAESES